MEVRCSAASDFEVDMHEEDQDMRGIVSFPIPLSLGMPVDRRLRGRRTPELPPSGIAPRATRPEGSVEPDSNSLAAPPSPEAGNGHVLGGRGRHINNKFLVIG